MHKTDEAIIVTGATGGIGAAIIAGLAARNDCPRLIGACRHPERLPKNVEKVSLDLSNPESVRNAANEIMRRGYKLRAIVNNAGIMPVRKTVILPHGTEQTLEVNCLATVRFTELLLPAIIDGGSIVFTTSVTRKLVNLRRDFATAAASVRNAPGRFLNYGRTKLMLVHYTLDLSERLASRGIRVNCADPGVVDTGIIHLGYKVVDTLADIFFRPFISTPSQGAEAALRAIDAEQTATIFTRRKVYAIPESWSTDALHREIVTAIASSE